jgi:hypothetical protein
MFSVKRILYPIVVTVKWTGYPTTWRVYLTGQHPHVIAGRAVRDARLAVTGKAIGRDGCQA